MHRDIRERLVARCGQIRRFAVDPLDDLFPIDPQYDVPNLDARNLAADLGHDGFLIDQPQTERRAS